MKSNPVGQPKWLPALQDNQMPDQPQKKQPIEKLARQYIKHLGRGFKYVSSTILSDATISITYDESGLLNTRVIDMMKNQRSMRNR